MAALGARGETPEPPPIEVPLMGSADPNTVSLPLSTILTAGLDAFNPCAFFVLMFLLSLLVHARDRVCMAVIGGIFVPALGVLSFAFTPMSRSQPFFQRFGFR